jgi:hypothetical protein
MQAFEESAIGAGTTVIKVRIPSQGRALCKVAQGGIEDGRAKVAVGGGAELVHAEPEGGESERLRVM